MLGGNTASCVSAYNYAIRPGSVVAHDYLTRVTDGYGIASSKRIATRHLLCRNRALTLGGKSADEARWTGAIDTADDQVEALFAPQYQTTNSPAHRAVWDRGVPADLFLSTPPKTPPDVQKVMDDSVAVLQRHVAAGKLHNDEGKIAEAPLAELGSAGYWGLLVGKEFGGVVRPSALLHPS